MMQYKQPSGEKKLNKENILLKKKTKTNNQIENKLKKP